MGHSFFTAIDDYKFETMLFPLEFVHFFNEKLKIISNFSLTPLNGGIN